MAERSPRGTNRFDDRACSGALARRRVRMGALLGMLALIALRAPPAWSEDGASGVWEAITQGKPVVDVRGRIEIADQTGLGRSEAYTLRTRLGYGTKPFHGVSAYMDFENIATPTQSTYFNPDDLPNTNNLTVIAEPPGTEVNQGYLLIDRPDWLGSSLKGGRQRIVFDDSRFVGDVNWRQNQQTFDALYAQTSAGIDALTARYAYIGHVDRIFGGGGNNPQLQDFDSNSNLINVSFTRFRQASLVGFVYLLDLTLPGTLNPQANSSKSFGARLTGSIGVAEGWTFSYQGSYAYQSQYAGKLPDYSADYGLVELSLAWQKLGSVGIGYEFLGSDGGVQQFTTPLATLHKFNGWADVFLDNGGPDGLQDFHASLSPKLPWQLQMTLVYHRFWSDARGAVLGNEFDTSLGRPIGKYFDVLFKTAYFDSTTRSPRPTTYRIWFDVNFKF